MLPLRLMHFANDYNDKNDYNNGFIILYIFHSIYFAFYSCIYIMFVFFRNSDISQYTFGLFNIQSIV